jgi:beta-glucanase (GH16 family)
MTTTILFQDDFSNNGPLNSANWDFNHWQQDNNPAFLGLTNMRQSLPLAQNGMARIELDTWNPATSQYPPTFLGSEAITKQAFALPGGSQGLAFEAKAKFEGTLGGMIAGFFTFQDFPPNVNRNIHDELDYEILTTNLQRVSTNVFAQEPLTQTAHPISLPQYPAVLPASLSFSDWHTYRMEWFPDHVSWFLDGTLIRTETQHVPTKPEQLHMNLWGVPTGWGPSPGDPPGGVAPNQGPPVGDPSFKPATSASANHSYFFDVTSVKVEQLSSPTLGAAPATTASPNDLVVTNDAYVTTAGHGLTVTSAASVLSNDSSSSHMHASLATGPSHGTLSLADDGTFAYAPNSGFTGTDSFVYQTTDDSGAIGASMALISVAPTKVGATTTLDFGSLLPAEQVATLYDALLGRGADLPGFVYWVTQQYGGISQKGALASINSIANGIAGSDEAKGTFALLANPKAASDAQIGSFLDGIYHNLFGHSVDAGGQAYWTGQIKQVIAAGQSLGAVVVSISNGAQESASNHDITALLNKVQVNLEYVNEQNALHTTWNPTEHDAAVALTAAVTADAHTVLTGIKQADNLILADVVALGSP